MAMDASKSPGAGDRYWGSRAGFILAALGSAAGLGNIWRFAYVAGESGGGAFFFVYLACVLMIGLPIMIAELAMGRAQSTAAGGAADLDGRTEGTERAGYGGTLGILAVATAFILLSYYSVVSGWALKYFFGAATGALWEQAAESYGRFFSSFVAGAWEPVFWQATMLSLTAWIVSGGVRRGIERANRILMPALLLVVVALAVFSLTLPGAGRGLAFLFAFDPAAFAEPRVYLAALGQAFFSLGVGLAVYVTYGRYLRPSYRIAESSGAVAIGDSLIAVLAGITIFSAVFSFSMDPAEGPELAFITLPQIFLVMPGGKWVAVAFFALLVMGALTSMVSVLEVPVAHLQRRTGRSRLRLAVLVTAACLALGIPSTLGFGVLSGFAWHGRGIMDNLDYLVSNLLLPAGGLLVALEVGWRWRRKRARGIAFANDGLLARLWHWFLRFAAPVLIAIIIVRGLVAA